MNQQKAVTNTTEASKGLELFGNWELSDSLADEELKTIAGGVEVKVGRVDAEISVVGNVRSDGAEIIQ
ncbi:hypothetical protein SD81_002225 [Tolypothrix campylonemoides VB511288]|nr:hypothetical protein SD81_002225 [Tolypothrix campylonemoides VB511288]